MESFIVQTKITTFQWKVIAICFFIVLLDGYDIAIVAYIAPLLKKEMLLSSVNVSYLFVSGVLGLMLGSMLFGSLADKFGRKFILIVSIALYGVTTILCGFVNDLFLLVLFRFLTGLGLGGAMPICIALCSEYSPQRYKMLLCTLSWSGFTLGISLGGIISSWLLQEFSWHWLFYIGGILPILSIIIVVVSLPESLEFLVRNRLKYGNFEKLRIILEKINGIHIDVLLEKINSTDVCDNHLLPTVKYLFKKENAFYTIFLWLTFFFSLMVFYLLAYWIPILFDVLFSLDKINFLASMLPLGGTLGAFLLAILIDYKKESFLILSLSYLTSVIFLLLTPNFIDDYNWLLFFVFLVGFTIAGAQNGINIVSATIYHENIRATGIGWSMASGRLGSIVGAYIGVFLTKDQEIDFFFNCLSIGTLICGLSLLCILLYRRVKNGL